MKEEKKKKTANSPIEKWAKDWNRHFPKEDVQLGTRYVERCSASVVAREVLATATPIRSASSVAALRQRGRAESLRQTVSLGLKLLTLALDRGSSAARLRPPPPRAAPHPPAGHTDLFALPPGCHPQSFRASYTLCLERPSCQASHFLQALAHISAAQWGHPVQGPDMSSILPHRSPRSLSVF